MNVLILIPSSGGGRKGKRAAVGNPAASGAPPQVLVLIVEDEWLVSMEIEAAVEEAGYAVAGVAVSADEAVRMAEVHRPDLIMMDIRLKGQRDGIDAAIEINRRLGLRCLFVTAYSDAVMKERAHAANPLGWVSKPLSVRQLVDALEAAIRDLRT